MSSAPSSPPDEARCPECGRVLELIVPGEATCPAGHGRALTLERARERMPPEARRSLDWVVGRAPLAHAPCPVCRSPMARGELARAPRRHFLSWPPLLPPPRRPALEVDACPACRVVWLEPRALGAL